MRKVEVTSKVWVKPSEGVSGHWANTDPVIAKFHQFGPAYEEFEAGPGNYTVAVIEMPDGTVRQAHLTEIRFLD
ncbi:hypothetical protein [Pseudomonas syringae]|uniref:Uncharacterized protein n=1 Tax=Pseudomonas syringae pv. solidagae TaxID=264458 RepID=A0A0P9ZQX3_PSESX|nr:hypothetical protein [Pseudomonas syringae]KPY52803.1 Unknown protein sequence [Pseudomonas syringae pv. solidagae]RMT48308.1 hypothetical protein ALP48_00146 [Pseudomonas syringae pv. solidagae]